jgi:hypothetical protein
MSPDNRESRNALSNDGNGHSVPATMPASALRPLLNRRFQPEVGALSMVQRRHQPPRLHSEASPDEFQAMFERPPHRRARGVGKPIPDRSGGQRSRGPDAESAAGPPSSSRPGAAAGRRGGQPPGEPTAVVSHNALRAALALCAAVRAKHETTLCPGVGPDSEGRVSSTCRTGKSATAMPRRYDLKLWIDSLRESATYPPA